MNIMNIFEIAGSMAAVAAVAGFGVTFVSAMCYGAFRSSGFRF